MPYPEGGIDIYETTYTFSGLQQSPVPTCYVPPECTLTLSGTTVIVAPTTRGDDDGTITAAFTSTSGATADWYLNGIDYGAHASPYTFTGLTAGEYQIYIEQSGCTDSVSGLVVPEGEFRTGAFFVSTPQEVSAVENPMILQLQTAVASINPLRSINTFTISGTITGTTISFALTFPSIYNAVFQSKGYPDRASYWLQSTLTDSTGYPKGTNSNEEICTSLAEALQADSVISRLYFITNSGSTVTLQAREYGNQYDLTTGNTTIVGGGVTLANTQSGQVAYDGQLASNYSVYAEIYVDPELQFGASPVASNFRRVSELELPFRSNNLMSFDLAPVLKNFVSSPKIDFTFTGFTTLGDMDTNYFIKYGEKYPLIENTSTKKKRYKGTTDTLYAINSALNFEDINDMSSYLGDGITNLNPNFSYTLTWTGTDYTVEFLNSLIDVADTGTTNVAYSIWNSTNTSIVEAWQSGSTITGLTYGVFYGRISGTTDGYDFMYSRRFICVPNYTSIDSTYATTLINDVSFLNVCPNPKYIPRGSKEFLYILMKTNYPASLSLRGDIYYYNGNSTTGITFFEISNLTGATNFGGVTMLACGYDELGLAAYEASGNTKIRRVDFAVWQVDANANEYPLTETRSYLLEIDEQPQKYDVSWCNKLGTYSTYSFVGEVVEGEEVLRQTFQSPYEINSAGQAGVGFQYNGIYDTMYTKTWVVNSGTIDEDTYYFLQDLLASNKIYNYSNVHENFLTIVGQQSTKSSNDAEYTVQITFKETIFENNIEK